MDTVVGVKALPRTWRGVVAVGLLSLATISLRSSGAESANRIACSNARMALMLALGELQKTAGDDRRVTGDGSLFDGAKHPGAVGVWKSWSPNLIENPTSQPSYDTIKADRFVAWLTSSSKPYELLKQDLLAPTSRACFRPASATISPPSPN